MSSAVLPVRNALPPSRGAASPQVFDRALSPEWELLVYCAQPEFDHQTATRVQALLHAELDWQRLTALAMSHGLSSIVYTRLEPFLTQPLPEPVLQLKTDAVRLMQYALVHTGEMNRLVPYLQAHGIETLVFKGPALAQSVYGRRTLRPFLDLDILVQPRDVAKAWSLLEAEGYTLAYNLPREQLPELMKAGNHLPLYGTHNNACVELHWTFFAKTRATFFDTRGAWARRVPLEIQGLTVMTLAPPDLVHFLCLHGTKHAWGRLAWLTDLVWFMARYPRFDWSALLDEARTSGTERMVLVGLALAHELFGSELEESVTRRIHADRKVLPLAQWMWERVRAGNQELPTGSELVQLVLRTRERRGDRVRDLYHHLMALRPNNIQDASHSTRLPGTSGLFRLVYLVRKYGRGAVR